MGPKFFFDFFFFLHILEGVFFYFTGILTGWDQNSGFLKFFFGFFFVFFFHILEGGFFYFTGILTRWDQNSYLVTGFPNN